MKDAFLIVFEIRPSLHFFFLCPFFSYVKRKSTFLWATFFLLFCFCPSIQKTLHVFQHQLAQLKFGCLISFCARSCFFFFLVSEPGRSEPGALLLFYLVSEWAWLVWARYFLFFVLGVWARYKRPSVDGVSALIRQLSAETMIREFWRFRAGTCFVS